MNLPWESFAWTVGFALSGLLVMFLGLAIFDILLPFKMYEEVENGNEAVGWMVAGFLISCGIILGDAFKNNLGWIQAIGWAALGILLNYAGYYLWEVCTPKWSLTAAIQKGSVSAGKVLFGLFIAIGLVVAGSFTP